MDSDPSHKKHNMDSNPSHMKWHFGMVKKRHFGRMAPKLNSGTRKGLFDWLRRYFFEWSDFWKKDSVFCFFLTYIIRWSQWQSPPSLKFRKKVKTLCFWIARAFKFGRPKFHVPDDLKRSGDINLESPTGGPRPNFSVSPLRNSPTYLKYPWLGIALLHFISLASTLASRVDGSIWTHQLGSPRR